MAQCLLNPTVSNTLAAVSELIIGTFVVTPQTQSFIAIGQSLLFNGLKGR